MRQQILEQGPEFRRKILFGAIVAVPLVFSRSFFDTYNVPKLGLLMMVVAVVGAIRAVELLQGAPADSLKRLLIPAAAILVPLAIAWAASPYKGWALFGQHSRFQGLIPYLVIVLVGILIADAFAGRAEDLAWALASAGALSGAYGVVQWLGLDPFPLDADEVRRVAVGGLGNPNFFGGFLAVSLPASLALVVARPDLRERTTGMTVAIVAGLVFSFSQGAWAAATAAALLAAGLYLRPRYRWSPLVGAGAALLMAGVLIAGPIIGITHYEHERVPIAAKDRGRYWEQAAGMFTTSPLIGRGPNAFAVEGVQYRPARDVGATSPFDVADDPHNVFLQFATSAGALGALGFLVLAGWVVRRTRLVEEGNVWGYAFSAGAVAYLLQSIVSIDEVGLRFALWACLGGIAAAAPHGPAAAASKTKRDRARSRRKEDTSLRLPALVAVVGLVALTGLWWAAGFARADARVRHAIDLFDEVQYLTGSDEFEAALGFREEFRYRFRYGFHSGMAAQDGGREGIPFARQRDEAFAYLESFPDVGAMRDYAQLLNRWSVIDSDAAQRAGDLYVRATTLDPVNPVLRSEAVLVLLPLERETEAETILQRHVTALHEDPVERAAALAEAWTDAAEGLLADEEAARFALAKALALDPTNERAMQILQTLDAEAEG